MPDDMKAVVERLTACVSESRRHWGSFNTPAVDVQVADLRALLSERRKMVEALTGLSKPDPSHWAAPEQHENSTNDYRNGYWTALNDVAGVARAALTGSRERG